MNKRYKKPQLEILYQNETDPNMKEKFRIRLRQKGYNENRKEYLQKYYRERRQHLKLFRQLPFFKNSLI